MSTVDAKWLAKRCRQVLHHARNKEFEQVSENIETIAHRYADVGIFILCCSLANVIMGCTLGSDRPAQGFAFPQVPGPDGPVDPESLTDPGGRGLVWATRFTAAWINGDRATAAALFKASMADDEQCLDDLVQLVLIAAQATQNPHPGTFPTDPSLN